MILKQNRKLIDTYENKLKKGIITDNELKILLNESLFSQSKGYFNSDEPVSEKNHRKTDAINDFVLYIAPQLEPEILHQLTARMINLSPEGSTNTFMRNATLEKAFLAYEMYAFPDLAAIFFKHPSDSKLKEASFEYAAWQRMQREFPAENDIPNLINTILRPIIDLFAKKLVEKIVERHYPHMVSNATKGRQHAFGVNGAKFLKLKEDLKNLKGDHLKSQILIDFQKQLTQSKTHQEVDALVAGFKTSSEYEVLTTSQGVTTRLTKSPTSSIKALNEMIKEHKANINNLDRLNKLSFPS
ncbi:hypothetical protein [Legionella sp.]|uniref:hypothetical protein n=1 Tax=Legionella sp. TaxID=459 RepID=UPI003CC389BF